MTLYQTITEVATKIINIDGLARATVVIKWPNEQEVKETCEQLGNNLHSPFQDGDSSNYYWFFYRIKDHNPDYIIKVECTQEYRVNKQIVEI